jgi:hypothetical protein
MLTPCTLIDSKLARLSALIDPRAPWDTANAPKATATVVCTHLVTLEKLVFAF